MGQKRTTAIPKAPGGRILINAGAKRVSQGAMDVFAEIIENIAMEVGTQAVRIAKHSGRKTVQEGDIKLAARKD